MAFAGKIAVLIGLSAAVYGGLELGQTLTTVQEARNETAPGETLAANPSAAPTEIGARPWPAVFGVLNEVAPAPAAPTAVSEDYRLIGLIAGQQIRWAIVAYSGGEVLVRVGEVLAGGEVVEDITTEGVWIRQGQKRQRIGFAAEDTATMSGPAATSVGSTAMNQSVKITRDTFVGHDLRRVFGRAGTIQMVAGAKGAAPIPEILWVRPGEIYDRLGLRAGDRVLRVNGQPAGAPETLQRGDAILASNSEVRLEILRGGVVGTITVILVESG